MVNRMVVAIDSWHECTTFVESEIQSTGINADRNEITRKSRSNSPTTILARRNTTNATCILMTGSYHV